jgi:transposase
MFNEKHPEGATGRGSGGRSVIVEDPRDGQMKPRAQVMKELYAEGQTRAEIAKQFDVAYATVYGATKDVEPPEGSKAARTGRVMITHPETGEKVARVDFIREQYALGKTRREIANMAGCDYTIVWMATKPVKEEGEEEAPTDAVESPDLELDTDPDLNY